MNNLNQTHFSQFDGLSTTAPQGEFVTLNNERYYAIYNVDKMSPFFVSLISPDDHWMFISSTGGLTAGRVSPDTALFSYVTVDRIHESAHHTGPRTWVKMTTQNEVHFWQPFNGEQVDRFRIQRNIYRNTLGSKLCFEEINLDLGLSFKYTWETSEKFGFSRHCQLSNIGEQNVKLEVLDGLQNILPAGTPRFTQTNSSNLVDAYKWTELESQSGLAMLTLYSGITDRAEPCESLNANVAYVLGLDDKKVLLSNEQVTAFMSGDTVTQEPYKRGIRGAYLVQHAVSLAAGESQDWRIVVEINLSQSQVVSLIKSLQQDPLTHANQLVLSVADGGDRLARIMAASDGFQATAEENVAEHHYANVLYNVLRGGIFANQYTVTKKDIASTIKLFNRTVYEHNKSFLACLPETMQFSEFLQQVTAHNDLQLLRLAQEYLPITFGRRHGDPSRPWNQFAINLKDEKGESLLSYQGNWRDIFQNWEALTLSYPEFVEGVIAKFVNASTMDGYNPYRITKEGIDWEVEEPDDPWSYIGYWGDHQIIYLLKLLESSQQFNPEKLGELLFTDVFCYANVPYRIKPFAKLLDNAKDTVWYDDDLAAKIAQRVADIGADGKMVRDAAGNVYQVNLLEKLLVPLLTKLSNLVIDGGIWLNTQRPEWNDANNALVGQGLSMVTLYYMRRYIAFLQGLLADYHQRFALSKEVADWLDNTAKTLAEVKPKLDHQKVSDELRFNVLQDLGMSATEYRGAVYYEEGFGAKVDKSMGDVKSLLADALVAIDHCIATNRADNGLFHAYNLLDVDGKQCRVNYLYPMLEGQVSALSTGNMDPELASEVLETLFNSDIYREDQDTFMLYPDRAQTPFLQKNLVEEASARRIPLLAEMLDKQDARLVERDANNGIRFNCNITNAGDLASRIDRCDDYDQAMLLTSKRDVLAVYEQVFNHQAFTGRSGGMFGFEGLGSIYWHMVSKLLLATYENFYTAVEQQADAAVINKLGQLYYRVRGGIGFNKTPAQYGAFPTDPYSHTPKHAGAQQPGMTGQVKEEVICRFAELGVRVKAGEVSFAPVLLRAQEFSAKPHQFKYLDVKEQWQSETLPAQTLGFTWCQLPIVYQLADTPSVSVEWQDGKQENKTTLNLSKSESQHLFKRDGAIKRITVTINPNSLFKA